MYLRMEENLVLKDMLADILKNNFDHSHLDQIEEFQNNFINEEQVTNHLRKAIVELQKQSSKITNHSMQEDGKTGMEKAIQYKPDLIICDIMMPFLDGYGVLHAIHRNEELKNIPFIFLTAKTERSDFRKGMELGADDYITKPFTGTELLNAVDSRLKKNKQHKGRVFPDGRTSVPDEKYART